ncbi:MAG TPA: zinc carboxypeptidase, partial [Phaeodactylibacter sp.]|nr:zinc carboxypeptidase [Phaeodactylibacter sp.]
MRNYFVVFFFLLTSVSLFSQKHPIDYFLPPCEYNPNIPTPESVLGFQVGEWHTSHDQLIMYYRELAKSSPRIVLKEYARTYENRPLYHLFITSEKNQARLEGIRKEHLKLSQPDQSAAVDISKMPTIVYQGFTIHGNEPSGANAALLVAYHLAAGQCEEVQDILDHVVILFDPVFNPDGFHRFSTWANSHKSKNMSADSNDREYNEPFPRGRTNHYWFDLNRDWLLLQHPESRGRVARFQEWKPNILTDHHEMGTNETFFFMPGVQTRIHPLTPKKNQELTAKIGTFHVKALDQIGSLYYTEEDYDDYYYGKGSTYPDANGSVGILFEQASSRGHLRATSNGLMSFPFTIRNQATTAMSTLRAAVAMREELLDYQREFYQTAIQEARKDSRKGFVFSESKDKSRLTNFVNLLQKHDIQINTLQQDISVNGKRFKKENSFYVPLVQPQYRLIKSVFDPIFKFDDSLFYDVSAFTLPMAYNIDYQAVTNKSNISKIRHKAISPLAKPEGKVVGGRSEYAYLFEWDDYYTPNAVYELLDKNLIVKVATKPLTMPTAEGKKQFNYGAIQIPVGNNQRKNANEIFSIIQHIAKKNGLTIYGVNTGFSPSGIDLGSGDFKHLKKPEVLLLVGEGVRSYDAGEVWHLLDQRYDMPITKMDVSRFRRADLSRYNCIVMVDGNYDAIAPQ